MAGNLWRFPESVGFFLRGDEIQGRGENLMSQETLIEVRSLCKRYIAAFAVSNLDFRLNKGEILALLGPNGAGKTTTLRMLAGTLAPTSGTVTIKGIDMARQPKRAKALLGYLPERPPLYGELTVDEYLRFCAFLHGFSGQIARDAVLRAKRACGLSDAGRRLIANLSTGYQQRVGLAQAIIHNPDVVILDEPTIGLDPNQIREIRALIRELGKNHSVILSSHILPEVQAVCDRVMIINRGRVVHSGGLNDENVQMEALQIVLRHAPTVEALLAIDNIRQVESLGNGRFRLVLVPDTDPREAIALQAVKQDWGLLELRAEVKTLEERFVELTSGDELLKVAA